MGSTNNYTATSDCEADEHEFPHEMMPTELKSTNDDTIPKSMTNGDDISERALVGGSN